MCTGLYVGKKVSQNGRALIGRSADSAKVMDNLPTIKIHESKNNQLGKFITSAESNIKYPLPEKTYKYISMPTVPNDNRGSVSSFAANEAGLFVTSSVTAVSCKKILDADPLTDYGLCEPVIPDIIGSSCKNTNEAIKLVAKLMEEYGSSGCENIMLADSNGAWIIELYSGHQWAAYKMPEDKVAVYGNSYYLTTEYTNCQENCFCHSKDLFELPKKLGTAVYIDGNLSIADSYEGEGNYRPYASIRAYFGHKLLAPSTAGSFEQNVRKPLFYTPDKKVSLKEAFDIYRSRYEGSEYCPETSGCDDVRLIGTEATYNVHIAEIYEGVPSDASIVVWACMGNALNSVFLPYSNLATKCAKSYEFVDRDSDIWDKLPLPKDFADRDIKLNEQIASVNYKKLCALASENMVLYRPGVYNYWSKKEQLLIDEFTNTFSTMIEKYKINKIDAIKFINEYSIKTQEYTEAEAKALFDELLWYIITNIETFQYWYSQFSQECTRKELPAFNPTMCYLDKYL